MPPRGRSRHPPAPTADDGNAQRDPAPIRQLCPGLSITDSQQNLRATAAPAFESSLCFTRNVQADASLRKRTPLGFSHPLVMAYPPHTTQTSLCAPENQLRSGIQGWGPAHPIPGTRAAHRLLLLGTRGLSSETGWLQTHSPDCFEDWEENKYSLENGQFVSLFAKWPLQEILIWLLIGKEIYLWGPRPSWRGNLSPPYRGGQRDPWRSSCLWRDRCLLIYEIHPSSGT